MDIAVVFNFCEAALWFTISAVFFYKFLSATTLLKPFGISLPLAFFVFGISDLIESQTGTWWEPWWLFVVKTACVLVILQAWLVHLRTQRAKKRALQEPPTE